MYHSKSDKHSALNIGYARTVLITDFLLIVSMAKIAKLESMRTNL